MPVICIDFGTSSIRAAVKNEDSNPVPLAIASESTIDNASIPSYITLSASGGHIFFGNSALTEALTNGGSGATFEPSPKAWFFTTNVAMLDKKSFGHHEFTRFELIAALVSFAGQRASDAAKKTLGPAKNMSFRITHPIWPNEIALQVSRKYEVLLALLNCGAGSGLKAKMTARSLRTWCDKILEPVINSKLSKSIPDPEEPIAAAIQLIGTPKANLRELHLVVDVGAGTSDLGLFLNVLPANGENRKLASLCAPRSIFLAGDHLDDTLMREVETHSPNASAISLADFRNNIRKNKERLFADNKIKIPGSRAILKLADFEILPAIQDMGDALEQAVKEMVRGSLITEGSGAHQLDKISVVYAGGGGELGFVRERVYKALKQYLPRVVVTEAPIKTPRNFGVDATLPRMAVALGGTCPKDLWPKGKVKASRYPFVG